MVNWRVAAAPCQVTPSLGASRSARASDVNCHTVPEPTLLIIFGGRAVGPINVSNAKLTCGSARSKVGIRVRSLY